MDWTLSQSTKQFAFSFFAAISFCLCLFDGTTTAGLVTIATSTPTGTTDRDSSSDFVGILDGGSPAPTIGGLAVDFANIPNGEQMLVGDLVGRDMNGHNGSSTWEYSLLLPSNAVAGTGFENIVFDGHAFEAGNNNIEPNDFLTWELFVNGLSVDSYTTGGQDFAPFDFTLANAGGATINDVLVVFTVSGFTGGNEWFATQGTLSATYTAIPEPPAGLLWLMASIGLIPRRRRTDS